MFKKTFSVWETVSLSKMWHIIICILACSLKWYGAPLEEDKSEGRGTPWHGTAVISARNDKRHKIGRVWWLAAPGTEEDEGVKDNSQATAWMLEWLHEWRHPKYRHRKKTRTAEDDSGFRHVELEWFMRWTIRLAFCPNMKLFKGWKIKFGGHQRQDDNWNYEMGLPRRMQRLRRVVSRDRTRGCWRWHFRGGGRGEVWVKNKRRNH